MPRLFLLSFAVVTLLLGGNPAEAVRASAQRINAPAAEAPAVASSPAHAQEGTAQEPNADAAGHESTAHEEGSGGMPQADATRFPGQMFWLFITFIMTYLLMRHVALPGVEQTLSVREKRISADISGSKAKNESAKRLMAEYETRLIKARADAQSATKAVTDESGAKANNALNTQGQKVIAQIKEAEARILDQKNKAIGALDTEVVGVVSEIVKSVAGITPSAMDVAAAIKKVRSA
jgi:F-type H+-transporting ATPase subunit b